MTTGVRKIFRLGLALLATGVVADVAVHAGGLAGSHHGPIATGVHLVVLAGMVVTFLAVLAALRVSARP